LPSAFLSLTLVDDGPDAVIDREPEGRSDNGQNARRRSLVRSDRVRGVRGYIYRKRKRSRFSCRGGRLVQYDERFFGLGETGRDESFIDGDGPKFDLISGSPDAFFFDAVSCEQIGIGFDCMADVIFAPNAIGDFLSEFEISGTFEFEEIHGEDAGEVFVYDDAFRASFRGTGIAAVPLPPAAAGYLVALGLLARVGRGKRTV